MCATFMRNFVVVAFMEICIDFVCVTLCSIVCLLVHTYCRTCTLYVFLPRQKYAPAVIETTASVQSTHLS